MFRRTGHKLTAQKHPSSAGVRVCGLEFRVEGFGFRVWGAWFGVYGQRFRGWCEGVEG